jgi:hypothetical protein
MFFSFKYESAIADDPSHHAFVESSYSIFPVREFIKETSISAAGFSVSPDNSRQNSVILLFWRLSMKKASCISAFILLFSAVLSAKSIAKKTSDIPLCGKTTGSVTVNMKTEGMCSAFGSLWVTAPDHDCVFRIDTAARKITGIISVKGMPIPICATDSAVLAGCYTNGSIACIDPVSNSVSKNISVPGGIPSSVLKVHKDIWVPSHGTGSICVFNSEYNNTGITIPVGDKPAFGVMAGTNVWYPCYGGTKIVCIDTASKKITASVDGGQSPVYAVIRVQLLYSCISIIIRLTRP